MRGNIIILIKVFQVFTFCEERNNIAGPPSVIRECQCKF